MSLQPTNCNENPRRSSTHPILVAHHGRGRRHSGAVESVLLSDPGPAFEPMSVRRCSCEAREPETGFNQCSAASTCGASKDVPGVENTFKIAGIDVHKSMLAVVISDVATGRVCVPTAQIWHCRE